MSGRRWRFSERVLLLAVVCFAILAVARLATREPAPRPAAPPSPAPPSAQAPAAAAAVAGPPPSPAAAELLARIRSCSATDLEAIVDKLAGAEALGLYQKLSSSDRLAVFSALPESAGTPRINDAELFRDQLVVSGSVFVDPGGGAFNYSLPAVWVYLGDDRWTPLGAAEWFDEPGYTYRIVTAPDRLIVIGEHSVSGDWALFTFVVDEP